MRTARTVFAGLFFADADFFAAGRLVVLFFAAIYRLVNRLLIRIRVGPPDEAGRVHESPQVFKSDWPVDLDQRPFNDVFELPAIDRPRTNEAQEVAPGFWTEPSSFVGTKNSEGQATSGWWLVASVGSGAIGWTSH